MPTAIYSQKIDAYLKPLHLSFKENADPDKAVQMKKYMRDQYDFYGINAPQRQIIFKKFVTQKDIPDQEIMSEVIKELWRLPQREYQYVGMELFSRGIRKAPKDAIDITEYMITNKSWWDTVDFIAAETAGKYFKKYPEQIKPVTGKWIDSENMWLNRSALLFQLKYRDQTDKELLFKYIKKHTDSKEFFLQKAIGWVLRQYSKTNPEAVESFVAETKMAPLSKKEAMRIISKNRS